ncbi:MAG: HAMP domain-containing protein [Clostridiales bacterium]|nr:HAMP domain-containing protein [Clostridiales bacterium]
MTQLYRRDYLNIAKAELVEDAELYAEMLVRPSLVPDSAQRVFIESIQLSMEKSNSELWIVNRYGKIRSLRGENEDAPDEMKQLTIKEIQDYLQIVLEGKQVIWENEFMSRFKKPMLTIAQPVIFDEEIPFVVFIHTELSNLEPNILPIYRQIGTASIIAVVVSLILVFISSSHITQPLKEMSKMTKEIAKGNLSKRVKIESTDEIGTLAESFNNMAEELAKQEELRTGFVANVSHELRSPLTSIHGFAQGMLDGTIESEDNEQYLGIIVSETTRLTKLIKELLDLSQIESGTFPLNKKVYDINEQMRRILIRYIDKIEDKGINVEVNFRQDFCMVCADADRIEQIFVNLIDNAIKFTSEEGTITLWTHVCEGKALVGVNDTGEGIPREDLPFVFERFYKSDKSHTSKKGTGLGLSIVKNIVEQHGHKITVNSTIGKGTSFAFVLDLAQEDIEV